MFLKKLPMVSKEIKTVLYKYQLKILYFKPKNRHFLDLLEPKNRPQLCYMGPYRKLKKITFSGPLFAKRSGSLARSGNPDLVGYTEFRKKTLLFL